MKLRLRELRIKKGFTLEDLAIKSGISKRMISAYEANENDITLTKLQNIAISLNVSISELIAENNDFSNLYEKILELNERIIELKSHLEDKEKYIRLLEIQLGINKQTGS